MLGKICSKEKGNISQIYYCEHCDYLCKRKSHWKQHIGTKKHITNSAIDKASKNMKNMPKYKCPCGKSYKHIQSYNRHTGKCVNITNVPKLQNKQENEIILKTDYDENKELRGMITTLISQNQSILTENTEMREMLKDVIPKIGNTTINNKFNLQIFLNEKCKDAINLTEFVETLTWNNDDLDETCQNGYVNGISNIIIRGLKQLELHKRPIHCSDLKREILYVKDNNTWERDDDSKKKMKNAITNVAQKQLDTINEWEESHKELTKTIEDKIQYIDIINNITSSCEEHDTNKIIKAIAKEVIIEKK